VVEARGEEGDENQLDCEPGSLRALGWRQGCLLRLDLPSQGIILDEAGLPRVEKDVHPLWMLAEQDCGMAWGTAADGIAPSIEIRAVFTESPPDSRGVRSAKFSLGSGMYLDAASPPQMVSQALLAAAAADLRHHSCPTQVAALELKTWLGLRYDRPAVPATFVETYKELSRRIRKKKHGHRDHVRDVLVAFATAADGGTLFDIVALLPADEPATGEIRDELADWLADICMHMPTTLGVPTSVSVVTAAEVSLDFIEHSYALDLSFVTWPAKGGGPVGAI